MKKTKVIILGGGFGGVYAALRLDKTVARRADVEVTLVSSNNFLLFTPMLHEVASGDLNPSDIVNPIRQMLNRLQFVQADVRSIDLAAKRVHCTRGLRPVPLDLDYDHLVLALGSGTNFFGLQGVAENAVTLKTLGDAALLRARILAILEMASPEPAAAVQEGEGRIMVDEFLEVPGFPGLWAIGDCAAVPDTNTGGPQPPTAQHALRQARHAAKNIETVLAGRQKKPFRFSTIGQLA